MSALWSPLDCNRAETMGPSIENKIDASSGASWSKAVAYDETERPSTRRFKCNLMYSSRASTKPTKGTSMTFSLTWRARWYNH
jgi:hypothetical protein